MMEPTPPPAIGGWAVRLQHVILYVLWLPLGSTDQARSRLRELIDDRDAFLNAWNIDQPLTQLIVLRHAIGSLKGDVAHALTQIVRLGAPSTWVYRVSDPMMVFIGLPGVFAVAGFAVGGFGAAIAGAGLAVGLWGELARRLRMRVKDASLPMPDRAAHFWTLPNALTLLRLATLGYFPFLLAHHDNLRALAFLAAVASTDWADGFVARKYGSISRIGTMLDPAADRLLMLVVLTSMWSYGLLPAQLALLLVAREAAVVACGLVLFRPSDRGGQPLVEVDWSGKAGFTLVIMGLLLRLAVPLLAKAPAYAAADVLLIFGLGLNIYALGKYLRAALPARLSSH